MKFEEMKRDELSLLLYLETRAVDYGGLVDPVHMNGCDFDIAKQWDKDGYIEFGRVKSTYVMRGTCPYWVYLTPQAWEDAHRGRRERAHKSYMNRSWKKTREKEE